ncbi:MAG: DEAD/DEAH box helicase [Eubacteriales bacterium]
MFEYFAPFIQDYIYRSGWQELRGVQLEAARVIFESEDNLLVTSATASGKTEAAFFPIISLMCENPPMSVGCIYVAPLKSLINDQFARLDELLDLSGIPVYHWHGDVAASHKNKLLKEPKGILQITPESLESMLMNRSNDIVRLFGDLRFVVIDEVHILTGTDRGAQIICQLNRIGRLIGHHPRRIGLSATVGDVNIAADWLGAGSGRHTACPVMPREKLVWKLGMEHFYIQNEQADQSRDKPKLYASIDTDAESAAQMLEKDEMSDTEPAQLDPGYEYLYDCVKNKKCLVFSNSREETEYVTATLRQIAEHRGDPDVFSIHHGNLSSSLREEAELKLKDDDIKNVTCATVTLELGIDIGRLERVVQMGSANSVSSFLQRLGRSGRRGDPPEMMEVYREEAPVPDAPLPQLIPWELLRGIAVTQLYLEERFIEPPNIKKMPMSLLFQQTLSTLASSGELTPKRLAERILSLPPFQHIEKEDYKTLLMSMLQNEYIQLTEEKGMIVGLKGERLINSFKFYAVFKDSEDYTVRCESDEIGTITTPPPVGDRFALAGRVWEVEELDVARKLIYVKYVGGKMEISWPGDYGEIHTKILERMKKILVEDTVYPYLKPNARHRVEVARALARNTGMDKHMLLPLGGYTWVLFPWLGTRSFRTLRKFIAHNGAPYKISNLDFDGCYYITFRMEKASDFELIEGLCKVLDSEGIVKEKLVGGGETPVFDKYDECIPRELLQKAYCADRLRTDEADARIRQIRAEM